ncbi:SDR family oxidoreductase [Alkalihalobacillus sp. LMS39]|uniref:SDR family NAD(P)-dependent oxidoreductase n=1 Tax=Alkalihalobacillus sp. LMS39 TaxID=2924032 RepID=UPI001FB24223|nr:SDR family oxidoreductase [Alkalihalobacillus sp. LMS39]UOE95658.1 SDR family oxidoreductase [Alkalihalobacillus sp. LMS39]
MQRFQHDIAVITGAGSGIGKEVAIQLALEGSKVCLVGRTIQKLEAVTREINESFGENTASYFQTDVTNEKEIEKLAGHLKDNYGHITVLVNNAGMSSGSSIVKLEQSDWENVQTTNVTSVFLMSKHMASLIEGENKAIVNIASLSGHKAGAKIPHYSTAKAAVIHFTKALAAELAPKGIRVNSVSPGFVETPMTAGNLENEQFQKAIQRHTALNRIGQPHEIAKVVAFVASSDASYMTGTDLLVDGGWLIT